MMDVMDKNTEVVLHGFLQLPNLQKLRMINVLNEYFDSNDKESVRAEHERRFAALVAAKQITECKCCGRRWDY